MKLEREILNVLVQAGNSGLKLEKIVRHVYNACNSMFNPLDYKTVYNQVAQYLIKCSKDPSSFVSKGKGYAVYHINFKNTAVKQLMLDFSFSSEMSDAKEKNLNSDESKGNTQVRDLFEDL